MLVLYDTNLILTLDQEHFTIHIFLLSKSKGQAVSIVEGCLFVYLFIWPTMKAENVVSGDSRS